jgi:hypothetical protein
VEWLGRWTLWLGLVAVIIALLPASGWRRLALVPAALALLAGTTYLFRSRPRSAEGAVVVGMLAALLALGYAVAVLLGADLLAP